MEICLCTRGGIEFFACVSLGDFQGLGIVSFGILVLRWRFCFGRSEK